MRTHFVKESVKVKIGFHVQEIVILKSLHGIAMGNVNLLTNHAMGFANTQDKDVAKNALTWFKMKSGNATVNVNSIFSLAMECAQLL